MELLVAAMLLGLIPAGIAHSKGRSYGAWWVYGALLFIIALPHSLLISHRQAEPSPPPRPSRILLGVGVAALAGAVILYSLPTDKPIPTPIIGKSASSTPCPATGQGVSFIDSASVVIVDHAGWTDLKIEECLRGLRVAKQRDHFHSLGIPPTTQNGRRGPYAVGTIYLLDVELPPESLREFANSKEPGYTLMAPYIKGYYLWGLNDVEQGFIGFRPSIYSERSYNGYRQVF